MAKVRLMIAELMLQDLARLAQGVWVLNKLGKALY